MVISKDNPIGLDAVIAEVQKSIYKGLRNTVNPLWTVDIDIYPRCYSLQRESRKTIEHFAGNGEYKELINAEGNKMFFVADNDLIQVGNGYFTTNIEAYFILNVSQIKPDVLHRADAEVWNDVLTQIPLAYFGIAERLVTDPYKVFSRYSFEYTDNMQKYHYFRIDLPVLEFQLDQIENCITN